MRTELEYREPPFCAYHYMASHGVVALENPSGMVWFYQNCTGLSCGRRFLDGYTAPELAVTRHGILANPHIDSYIVNAWFCPEDMRKTAKRMLDMGYYVLFDHVDDYYVEGKSFFGERHFYHDGLILGYDDTAGTLILAAYNNKWSYGVFETSMDGFMKGLLAAAEAGERPRFIAARAKKEEPSSLDIPAVFRTVEAYLRTNPTVHDCAARGEVRGTDVHLCLVRYLELLAEGGIPYEKMDWRVMRLLWEQKKCLCGCIREVERALSFSDEVSRSYQAVVDSANLLRIQYARYHMKRDDALIPKMTARMLNIKENEVLLLEKWMEKVKKRGNEDAVEYIEA